MCTKNACSLPTFHFFLEFDSCRSRQFGFVGFKTVDQAVKAMKHFDKSFFDTLKISVEYSHKVNDASLHRPWSKHSKGSSKYEKVRASHYLLHAQSTDNDSALIDIIF